MKSKILLWLMIQSFIANFLSDRFTGMGIGCPSASRQFPR